jgi:hypothetical protein
LTGLKRHTVIAKTNISERHSRGLITVLVQRYDENCKDNRGENVSNSIRLKSTKKSEIFFPEKIYQY